MTLNRILMIFIAAGAVLGGQNPGEPVWAWTEI